MLYLLLASLLLCLLGLWLLANSRQARRETGLPAGELVYSDTGLWERVEEPLLSRRYGLVGRPDYLVEVQAGGQTLLAPIEVKSQRRPPTPHESHLLQLAAYCLLVEETYRRRPPYGLLHYADATLQIPYTDELRQQMLESAEQIRAARRAADVDRHHSEPARCRHCGYRSCCGQELA